MGTSGKSVAKGISCLISSTLLATLAMAQTPVTTTGGTANTVPMFSGSSTVVDSAITQSNGTISIGLFTVPAATGQTGAVSSTGNDAGFLFLRRTLTSLPTSPASGDGYAWYNPDGTARLWTYGNGDLLTISPSTMTFGSFATPSATGHSGAFNVTGDLAALGFVRRTLTSWPATPTAGDNFVWYNPDGTARLWTLGTGDVLRVQSNGELDLIGALRFSDGSLQTTAATGSGGITSITAGSGLTGGGTRGNVTLAVDSTVARTNVSQAFNGDLTINGTIKATHFNLTMAISGSCITESFATPYVLNGLGQAKTTDCTYSPGSPTMNPALGTVLPQTGTLSNLQVVQTSLSSADAFGGQIQVFTEPFNQSGGWTLTSIGCTLSASFNNPLNSTTSCNDSSHTLAIQAGEKILVLVTPPSTGSGSYAPVSAVLNITY